MINPCIGSESGGITRETGGEITPNDQTRIIKEKGGETFGRNLGKFSKDQSKNNGKEEGLKYEPRWAKNGLFILGEKVPPNQ